MKADEDLYRIGTTATLTGIAVERLRAWERRYGLVPARRSGRTRFYSRGQLAQLTLIKQLIDLGQPISSLAGLTVDQLRERLSGALPDASKDLAGALVRERAVGTADSLRAGLIGPNLLLLEFDQNTTGRLQVLARWANLDAFLADRTQIEELDVIVVQMPVLLTHRLKAISTAQPRARIVALYQFSTPKHMAGAQEGGFPVLRWPASWAAIEHACQTDAGLPLRATKPVNRRFSDPELIAMAAGGTDPNRCPQHLVELITNLNAFVEYASNCAESVSAARGHYYERIQIDATQARAQLELALEACLEAEEAQDRSP